MIVLRRGVQEQEDSNEEEAALEPILSSRGALETVMAPLSGKSSAAADDDLVREALAEAVLILVGGAPRCLIRCIRSPA